MGRCARTLSLLALCWAPLAAAQVPAQATVLSLRGIRENSEGLALAFDVRDARGNAVPGVSLRDVEAWAGSQRLTVTGLQARTNSPSVWVLDATRRARMEAYAAVQQAFASWADSLEGQQVAVVAAGRPPKLVQSWSDVPRTVRQAVDNVAPRADEAELGPSLILAAETCAQLPQEARRCAVLLVSDARDALTPVPDSVAAQIDRLHVPLYAALIGSTTASSDALARLVEQSGGMMIQAGSQAEAVAALRQRLQEAYVAQVSKPVTGQPISVRLRTRTADGRTLADSATVELMAAPDTAASSTALGDSGRREETRWKLWLGLLSALVVGGVAWLLFGRRAGKQSPDVPPISASPVRPASPASAVPREAVERAPLAASLAVEAEASPPTARVPWPALRRLESSHAWVDVDGPSPRVIGRAAPADVVIEGDRAISTRHAILEQHGARIVLRDLGSTNGTSVNGVPVVGSVVLAEGDVVRLGETDLRVSFHRSDPA